MIERTISLHSVDDVKKLVTLANSYPFDIRLSEGKYTVNAKSVMGVFSLDLSKKIKLVAECEEDSSFCEALIDFVIE